MRQRLEAAGRRFARLTTQVVVARPALWRLFRGPMRRQFGSLASSWEGRIGPEGLVPLGAALDRLDEPPRKALDLGTGTGKAARVVAKRFPDAEVVGVDLAPEMVEEAQRLLPSELAGRVSFEVADGASLPFPDGGVRPRRPSEHDPVLRGARPGHCARRPRHLCVLARSRDADLGPAREASCATRRGRLRRCRGARSGNRSCRSCRSGRPGLGS